MKTKKDRCLEDVLEIVQRAFSAGHRRLAIRVLARWARANRCLFSLSNKIWVEFANGPVGRYAATEWDGKVSDDEEIYPY